MSQQTQVLYEFGPYRLNPAQQLLAEGPNKIPLTPKAFQTLLVLVESQGRIVTKDELLRKVWPDAFVEEATLAQNVFTLRKQLSDERGEALYIETVPKRGYRFVADVRQVNGLPTTPARQPTSIPHKIFYGILLACLVGGILAGSYWTRSRTPPG